MDLISRQGTIDALAEQMPLSYTPDGSHPADQGIFMAQEIYVDCIETIKKLPPAEPEIIYCKDCVHHIDGFFCRQANHHTSDKDYCASVFRAERRTDD